MPYGISYQGSKSAIIFKIINAFPNAQNFYDLFGGGGAVTHAMSLSGKYNTVIYNELNENLYNLFKDGVNDKFKNEKRWISNDYFLENKDKDIYILNIFGVGLLIQIHILQKEITSYGNICGTQY